METIKTILYPGSIDNFRAYLDGFLHGSQWTSKGGEILQISSNAELTIQTRSVWDVVGLIHIVEHGIMTSQLGSSNNRGAILALEKLRNQTTVEFIDGVVFIRSFARDKDSPSQFEQYNQPSIGSSFVEMIEALTTPKDDAIGDQGVLNSVDKTAKVITQPTINNINRISQEILMPKIVRDVSAIADLVSKLAEKESKPALEILNRLTNGLMYNPIRHENQASPRVSEDSKKSLLTELQDQISRPSLSEDERKQLVDELLSRFKAELQKSGPMTKKGPGRYRLTKQELADRKKIVREAQRIYKASSPKKTWKQIAAELDVPERTLRAWRHDSLI